MILFLINQAVSQAPLCVLGIGIGKSQSQIAYALVISRAHIERSGGCDFISLLHLVPCLRPPSQLYRPGSYGLGILFQRQRIPHLADIDVHPIDRRLVSCPRSCILPGQGAQRTGRRQAQCQHSGSSTFSEFHPVPSPYAYFYLV